MTTALNYLVFHGLLDGVFVERMTSLVTIKLKFSFTNDEIAKFPNEINMSLYRRRFVMSLFNMADIRTINCLSSVKSKKSVLKIRQNDTVVI